LSSHTSPVIIELLIVTILTATTLVAVIFLLGFRLGGEHWQSELTKVRLEAAQAERQLHNLTRYRAHEQAGRPGRRPTHQLQATHRALGGLTITS
jgi:hypothetical protein